MQELKSVENKHLLNKGGFVILITFFCIFRKMLKKYFKDTLWKLIFIYILIYIL
jgi:hypothetical protein